MALRAITALLGIPVQQAVLLEVREEQALLREVGETTDKEGRFVTLVFVFSLIFQRAVAEAEALAIHLPRPVNLKTPEE